MTRNWFTAVIDLHAQALLQMPQVFVELAAEVGEARVIRGLQAEVHAGGEIVGNHAQPAAQSTAMRPR